MARLRFKSRQHIDWLIRSFKTLALPASLDPKEENLIKTYITEESLTQNFSQIFQTENPYLAARFYRFLSFGYSL